MLGKNIKAFRTKKGWSQQKLAEAASLSYATITKLEQGRAKEPTIHSMIKLADALGVSIDALVGRTPPK
ncbi:MAG: helix-turn-helix transcriptional regulator [Elusimicrobia bacterium]|nr:helix-turn-helix transcriptional regulator [Elusimicrobiota bacterium]MBK7545668.1 helix-turn-helix transcriptional regulator [Elusimicrobiota bacterium]MBK7687417.1 helix-turn-helix transcriptional regulator [Elusimicrobiota bacterium]MBK8125669.1 helix-turn-helix transcriptional regulator [Elusimicrobiota bacterium]MBK8423049.1 helix-turn-helix transcriptional regulator [Elusimicrobiota bacterium]